MEKAGPFDCCCSHQSVASPSLLVSGLAVDILSTFCDGFMERNRRALCNVSHEHYWAYADVGLESAAE